MTHSGPVLHIAEIPFESGELKFRYSRYLADDRRQWIRHGPFTAFYKDGTIASEGTFEHGSESGVWRDYHENGRVAAQGEYRAGMKHGVWRYWNEQGKFELEEKYELGVLADHA